MQELFHGEGIVQASRVRGFLEERTLALLLLAFSVGRPAGIIE